MNAHEKDEKHEDVCPIQLGDLSKHEALPLRLGPHERNVRLKLPPFIGLEKKPFEYSICDALSTSDPIEASAKVSNVIRWKKTLGPDGKQRIVSNAKFVKWRDGTMSLVIGEKYFDMSRLREVDNGTSSGNSSQTKCSTSSGQRCANKNGMPVVSFFPNPDDIPERSEGDVIANVRQKGPQKKSVPVQIVPILDAENPEDKHRKDITKAEAELRAQNRREAASRRRPGRRLSQNFLEEHDSDEGESLATIKNKYKFGNMLGNNSSESDEYDSDGGAHRLDEVKIESDDSDVDVSHEPKGPLKKRIVEDEEKD
ncbi:hypothetical protein QR680_018817 [Steinernema hermaphroditum]|uniref:Leo1-like protein n=1 Tax=Steinernema hermaphroditum TaxID=289476 RepID=A0AA39LQX2_9BILA|nr:hypothetical protein QR680_018817 [Steinernema hermaphroditum]